MVVVFCFDCYHKRGRGESYVYCLKQKSNFGRWDFCFFHYTVLFLSMLIFSI